VPQPAFAVMVRVELVLLNNSCSTERIKEGTNEKTIQTVRTYSNSAWAPARMKFPCSFPYSPALDSAVSPDRVVLIKYIKCKLAGARLHLRPLAGNGAQKARS